MGVKLPRKIKPLCQLVVLFAVVGFIESTPRDREQTAEMGTTEFFLYTQSNPDSGQKIVTGDLDSISKSFFDPSKPTKIIIHGWSKSGDETPNPELRSAYLSTGDHNLISVDWQEYAGMDYISARCKVNDVGADVAELVDFLNMTVGLSFDSLVIIGHNLGAHCAGFAGKLVKQGRLRYIVGLDPAFPLFFFTFPDERLNSDDADYVETIQTNGRFKGFLQPIGTASFYPNWGRIQPGCGSDTYGTCAHERSVAYYAEAVRGNKFTPVNRCSRYTDILKMKNCDELVPDLNIGDPTVILRENGIFFFETASKEPFGHK